jgi:hypothetical protein
VITVPKGTLEPGLNPHASIAPYGGASRRGLKPTASRVFRNNQSSLNPHASIERIETCRPRLPFTPSPHESESPCLYCPLRGCFAKRIETCFPEYLPLFPPMESESPCLYCPLRGCFAKRIETIWVLIPVGRAMSSESPCLY